ncbi:jg171 [Pararge aegeria aegeria]|uniref:Jg171 protein n=1 Tax=Pararge aegeria aegeria TaxID=348720 RepID=A0A8S4QX72_9NEOP|nr:jg171 [Pararge aegeria aegeria]
MPESSSSVLKGGWRSTNPHLASLVDSGLISSAFTSTGRSTSSAQSLDQLLERQWEQGSQFLMEQAQHFDNKHPDTEKHSCSSHKHFPVVVIEPTALNSENSVATHCASRPSPE